MTAYALLDDLKADLGVDAADTSQDVVLTRRLEFMARWLDVECERTFTRQPVAGDATFTFHGHGRRSLPVRRGIVSIGGIEVAEGTGQSYAALDPAGWYLDPPDLLPEDSYDRIVLTDVAGRSVWSRGVKTIRLTGTVLGFLAVPTLIVAANLDGARELHRQGPGGGGPVGVNQFGTPLFLQGMPRSVSDAVQRYAWRYRDFSSVGTRRRG